MVWRGELVRELVKEAADRSARDSAESVLIDANFHVPNSYGTLKDSGEVTQGRDSSGHFASEAFVSYDTGYAVRLHENPQFKFRPPGEGKWLDKAMKRHQRVMLAVMSRPLVEVFKLP